MLPSISTRISIMLNILYLCCCLKRSFRRETASEGKVADAVAPWVRIMLSHTRAFTHDHTFRETLFNI